MAQFHLDLLSVWSELAATRPCLGGHPPPRPVRDWCVRQADVWPYSQMAQKSAHPALVEVQIGAADGGRGEPRQNIGPLAHLGIQNFTGHDLPRLLRITAFMTISCSNRPLTHSQTTSRASFAINLHRAHGSDTLGGDRHHVGLAKQH